MGGMTGSVIGTPRIVVFVIATAGLACISRRALRSTAAHGFFRFFAWEAILLLLLLNFVSVGEWFGNPLSGRQIASWIFLGSSLVMLAPGVHLLRARGRPNAARRGDDSLFALEKTTELVTTGIFRYVRHPLYSSLLFLAWGVFFKRPGWMAGVLALAATGLLYGTARAEEAENVAYFGDAYRAYMKRSRRFVPYLF